MNQQKNIRLGVNIDHVATIRQARGTRYPDPIYAALIAQTSGADSITLHVREDRRHIQMQDVELLKAQLQVPMNLEIAATEEMLQFAERIQPEYCCLVPERREELTTEGGLNVVKQEALLKKICQRLAAAGITVSLFIDPDKEQILSAQACGAPVIELHTGKYAEAKGCEQMAYLQDIQEAAVFADAKGLLVNAGHGLHYHNVQAIAEILLIRELNIGHSIVAQALFEGFAQAVREMKKCMEYARFSRLSAY